MRLPWLFFLAALLVVPSARASEQKWWSYRSDLYGGANPPGLMSVTGAFLHSAYKGRPLETGVSAGLSPAYGQGSLQAEWTPFPMLVLAARGDVYRYFGAHSALLSFPRAGSAYGTPERNALSGQEQASYGHRLMLQPTLRGKLGRFIVLNQTDIARYGFTGRGPFFLELENDTLLKSQDTLWANRTFLLYNLNEGPGPGRRLVGPYYEFQHAQGSRLERARLGTLVDLVAKDLWHHARARFNLLSGIDLRDPNRRYQLFFAGGVGLEFGGPLAPPQ